MLFAGIDWSDEFLDYRLCDQQGQQLIRRRVENNFDGIGELFLALESHASPDQIGIAIETTHGPWIQALLDRGYVVYPINPKRADAFRESLSANGDKTDPIDTGLALMLVTMHRDLTPLKQDDPEMVSLRLACQDRLRLVSERTAKGNELLSVLKVYYPAFPGLFGDHRAKIALQFLMQFPTQQHMQSISPAKLRKWLKTHSYNTPQRIDEMIEILRRPALRVPDHQQKAKVPLIQFLCTSLLTLDELIARQESDITDQFNQLPQSNWAKSLPGAATTLEPSLLAIFGRDPKRFATVEEARALFGTAPVPKISGKTRIIRFRRGCWKFARRTLQLFADCSRKLCGWAAEFYDRKRAAGKKHHEALRALAHKWVKIIWALVRSGQTYDEALYVRSCHTRHVERINRRTKMAP
jgi:transposase